MKEPDYFMKIIASWVTLYVLEGVITGIYLIYGSGTKEKNTFAYFHPFGLHFRYRHKVENHNNWRHSPILLEGTYAIKF